MLKQASTEPEKYGKKPLDLEMVVSTATTTTASEATIENKKHGLLRFGIPLMITESVIRDDFLLKASGAKAEHKKRRLKDDSIGLGAPIGRHVHNICMRPAKFSTPKQLLTKIQAPYDTEKRGNQFRQTLSEVSSTSADVIQIQELFNKRMKEFGLEHLGPSQKHKELVSECFEEIIRQVSITSTDRGRLLLAVHAEFEETFNTYELLFSSAIAYGIRKELNCKSKIEEWEKKIDQIEDSMYELREIESEFKPVYNNIIKKYQDQIEADEKLFQDEKERLETNSNILKNLLLTSVRQDVPEDEVQL